MKSLIREGRRQERDLREGCVWRPLRSTLIRRLLSFAGLLFAFTSSVSADEKAYYEKRVSIVGFPSSADFVPAASKVADTKSVLQNLRLTGVSYSGMTPQQADELAKSLRQQGYNAVIGGGHRYLFSDVEGEKIAPHAVCGGTFEQLLRDAKVMTAACRKHGLKFFLHQTSTMVDQSLIERHPDWAAIDLMTGKTIPNGYGTANTCINNDEFIAEFSRRLARLLKESGADGLLQDEIQFFSGRLCAVASRVVRSFRRRPSTRSLTRSTFAVGCISSLGRRHMPHGWNGDGRR